MTEQGRRRAATRERLIAAAFTLISEHSLTSVSVESVCELAGFTRGAFYSNFGSMDDLLVALFEKRADDLLTAGGPMVKRDPEASTQKQLMSGVADHLLIIPTDREWFLLVREIAARSLRLPEARRPYIAFHARLHEQTVSILDEEIHELGLRATVDLGSLATSIVAIINGWLEQIYLNDVDRDIAMRTCAATVAALLIGATGPAEPTTPGRPASTTD
ncbi:DNA-binding transcriptional regulator, AcrR family [Propionibacterium cyclohexanicum]|uniref:DNA-binding transcriptional regulator, AcrR family n=1 Tax=Propionibacterium cyclohexanicum TaxID=64702 RepID=A0A1H9SMS8_9ACTN|nr:TetR/AcrR family transcriptional regulator [Propionibacterium cyclohexanicum]SER86227.1 DNA-binding transcriptional regulator, AcrR family [Propionibacterium cyclohexanicum]